MNQKSPSLFMQGLRDGFPICMGYFSVSFAFGIAVVGAGLPVWVAVLISMTNLTSAGQLAGLTIIAAGGGLLELAMTQLVANIRYGLMSFSLTQKLSPRFRLPQRLLGSFFITDEIFALSASRPGEVTASYYFGLALLPFFGWTGGTWLGAAAGNLLPAAAVSALGIAIYGMFIAVVAPAAQKSKQVLLVVSTAILLSCLFHWLPILNRLSDGFVIIISAVTASLLGAFRWPVEPVDPLDASEPEQEVQP